MSSTTTQNADVRSHAPATLLPDASPACPECGGRMWDNRSDKRNPKAPDFKCRNRACDGRMWPGQFKPAESTASTGDASTRETSDAAAAPRGPLADTVDAVMSTVGTEHTPSQDVRAPVSAALRAGYLDITDFVLAEVRPRYDAAGVPCSDVTVAAIAATLFIATRDRGAIGAGVGSGSDASAAAPGGA